MDYCVRGNTVANGSEIIEYVEADNERQAYGEVFLKHGKLKKGCQVYAVSQLDGTEEFPEVKHFLSPSALSDEEVISIAAAIRENTVTREQYRYFTTYFAPIVKNAINHLWNDIEDITPAEIEAEMIVVIATRFMPRVDGRGRLRKFIKLNVQSELMKRWGRKKYVNGKKDKPRAQLQKEYLQKYAYIKEIRDPAVIRANIITVVTKLKEDNLKLSLADKKLFFGDMILPVGMHKECLKKPCQIEAIERCYGEHAITEKECGKLLGRTQATIHRNKQRAEANILEYIEKNFCE